MPITRSVSPISSCPLKNTKSTKANQSVSPSTHAPTGVAGDYAGSKVRPVWSEGVMAIRKAIAPDQPRVSPFVSAGGHGPRGALPPRHLWCSPALLIERWRSMAVIELGGGRKQSGIFRSSAIGSESSLHLAGICQPVHISSLFMSGKGDVAHRTIGPKT